MKKIVLFVITSLLFTFLYLSVQNTYSLFTKKIDKTGSINTIKSEATFLDGGNFNKKIKLLSGDVNPSSNTENTTITSIIRTNKLTITPTSDNIVSDSNSLMPIYAWFDNGIIYYYSEANTLYTNAVASGMFRKLSEVISIDVTSFNTIKTQNVLDIFGYDYKLENLDVSNFNTSNFENMQGMFFRNRKLTEIDVSNFNTSNVTNMQGMFEDTGLKKLDISNFDMTKVTELQWMLSSMTSLEELKTPKIYPSDTTKTISIKTMYDENMVAYTTLGKSTTPTSPTQTWLKIGYTVSFDADGGTVSPSSKVVRKDGTYGNLPTPTKAGYNFIKWSENIVDRINLIDNHGIMYNTGEYVNDNNYIAHEEYIPITGGTTIYSNMRLNAVYSYDENKNFLSRSITQNNNFFYTVDNNASYIRIEIHKSYGTYTNYVNNLVVKDANNIIDSNTMVLNKDHTLYAIWEVNTYTVTFDANGGTVSSSSKSVTYASTYGNLPEPVKDGYIFLGWNGNNKYNNSTYSVILYSMGLPISSSNGIDILSSDSSSVTFYKNDNEFNSVITDVIQLKPNTNYVVSFTRNDVIDNGHNMYSYRNYIYSIDDNGNYGFLISQDNMGISQLNNKKGNVSLQFTTTSTGKIALAWSKGDTASDSRVEITNIKIEEGTTSTTYEPYYITSDVIVKQSKNHTLTAQWLEVASENCDGVNLICINSLSDLETLKSEVNAGDNKTGKYYIMSSDIDMGGKFDSDGTMLSGSTNWTGIGNYTSSKPFSGIFDGNGHIISNLYINSNDDSSALFSYIQGAEIRNLGIENSYVISSADNTAALISRAYNSIVDSCYNAATVKGQKSTGGLVAFAASNSQITNCYNLGSVDNNNKQFTGGIIGYKNQDAKLENCYNAGKITGGYEYGGIAGGLQGTVSNVYNLGETGAGIIGQLYNKGKIVNSYNSGVAHSAGIVSSIPSNMEQEIINSSYLDTSASYAVASSSNNDFQSQSDNGIIPLTSSQMPTVLSVINGDNAFKDDTYNINNGYPLLKWQQVRVGMVKNYDYNGTGYGTGTSQIFVSPIAGTYKIEVWGAQGGSDTNQNRAGSDLVGGYGGYSTGELHLNKDNELYVFVAEMGKSIVINEEQRTINIYPNGGAIRSKNDQNYDTIFNSGGGSTHVATTNKLIKDITPSSSELVIVAGGGGGVSNWWGTGDNGGSGGGYIGGATTINYHSNNPTGGTQSQGGSGGGNIDGHNPTGEWLAGAYGQGAGYGTYNPTTNNISGAGGGGYYGGGASWGGSGAGGSGYIANSNLTNKSMYCYNCEESLNNTTNEEKNIFTVSTTGDSNLKDTTNCPDGYSSNPISKCAKAGNGYARITLISID